MNDALPRPAGRMPEAATQAQSRPDVLIVACLCAAWCNTCTAYRPVFDQLAAQLPDDSFVWIDIEDQADLLDDIDVETFPTILIAQQGRTLFFGPMLPHLDALRRLVESLRLQGCAGIANSLDNAAVAELVGRLTNQVCRGQIR